MSMIRRSAVCAGGMAALALGACAPDVEGPAAAALRERFPAHAAEVLDTPDAFELAGDAFAPAVAEESGPGLRVSIPRGAPGLVRLEAPSGLHVDVREAEVQGEGALVSRAVAFRRAAGTSYWTVAPGGGAEEWLHLGAGVAYADRAAASWEVEGATLRLSHGIVEALDDAGVPRLRVTAPVAYAASGREVPLRLEVRGSRIELMVDAGGEEVLVDPVWTLTSAVITKRVGHTATLLTNGKVLVTGGQTWGGQQPTMPTTEIYDPATDTWSPAAPMAIGREYHAAVRLGNGKVLVFGGGVAASNDGRRAEVYDPATDTWSAAATMRWGGLQVIPTLLTNGRVLAIGPVKPELYDPVADTWTQATSTFAHYRGDASTLPDGRVLVTGGMEGSTILSSVEIYDPASGLWAAAPAMSSPRWFHTATAQPNGRVLVAGGEAVLNAHGVTSTESFDPVTGTWSAGPALAVGRSWHTATLLPTGKLLVAGGYVNGTNSATAEICDAAAGMCSAAPMMLGAHVSHTATALGNGKALLVGGSYTVGAELFSLASAGGAACSLGSDCVSGFCVDGVCCNSACGGGSVTDCQACSVAAGAVQNGVCGPSTGNRCDDGNACTQVDTCQAGACTGGSPVTCGAPAACHVAGTCDPSTGACSNPAAPDGTACDDGDACTLGDTCQAGVCTGGGPSPACGQVCVTIQRGVLGAVADALINAAAPSKSYGASQSLTASSGSAGVRQGLLRFDLSSIPSTATVTSATLHLTVMIGGAGPMALHRITAPWSESAVTWSSFAGAFAAPVEATLAAVTTPTADLTALAQAWVSGATQNHGVLLERTADGSTIFASSEFIPSQQPRLDVCYVP